MAIKKREPVDQARIEAFGDAADAQPAASPVPTSRPAPAPKKTPAGEWPEDVPRTFLLRWTDPTLPGYLAEVAALEDRTQQKVALRALRLGLDAIKAQHRP